MRILILMTVALGLLSCELRRDETFEEVYLHMEDDEYGESINLLMQIRDKYPKTNSNYFEVTCLIGQLNYDLEKYDQAKIYLKEGIAFYQNPYSIENVILFGKSENPLNPTKDHACQTLAEILISEKKFEEAYRITRLRDSLFSYTSCGTMMIMREGYINETLLDCALNLGHIDKVIETLQNRLFFLSEEHHKEEFIRVLNLFKMSYSTQELELIPEKLIENLKIEPVNDFGEEGKACYTKLLGHQILVASRYQSSSEFDSETNRDFTEEYMLSVGKQLLHESQLLNEFSN